MAEAKIYTHGDLVDAANRPKRRSANFTLDYAKSPDEVEAAYKAGMWFFSAAHQAKERVAEYQNILANPDLKDAAKQRDSATMRRETVDFLRGCFDGAVRAIAEMRSEVDARIGKQLATSFAPLPADMDRGARALAVRIEAMAKQNARAEVDRLLDRALAKAGDGPDGATLAGMLVTNAYNQILADGDAVTLAAFEGYGARRVQTEFGDTASTPLMSAIGAARESRLPEDAKVLLDFCDAFKDAELYATSVLAEAQSDEFWTRGEIPTLKVAAEAWPDLAAEES